jgi:hypothetical protein
MPPGYQGGWVVFDILPDLIESFVRPDDVFPVVALPNASSGPFGYCGLEGTDHDGEWNPFIAQDHDAMKMVGHDHEHIQRDLLEMLRDFSPAGGNYVAIVM